MWFCTEEGIDRVTAWKRADTSCSIDSWILCCHSTEQNILDLMTTAISPCAKTQLVTGSYCSPASLYVAK